MLQAMPIIGMAVDSTQQLDSATAFSDTAFSQYQIEQISEIAKNTFQQQVSDPLSCTIGIAIAVGAAVLVGVACIYLLKRQQEGINSLEKKMQEDMEKIEILENMVQSQEKELDKICKNLTHSSPFYLANPQNLDQRDSQVHSSKLAAKPIQRNIRMYADFYLNGDTSLVDHRDLSENPADGMFLIMMQGGGSKARYTVNQSKQKAILEDILNFTNFVNIKDFPATYSSIKVESEGELIKSGVSWKIVKKMDVKLI